MKWTEYPNDLDRRENRNGTLREGQELASAPGGWKWAVTTDEPRQYALLHRTGGKVWSLAGENR